MNDPRAAGVPVHESHEPLVDMRELSFLRVDARLADPAGSYALLREGVAWRLARAARLLPEGLCLLVTEGYRPLAPQQRYGDRCAAELGPHVTGAAVDVTLCSAAGDELDLGTAVHASPEESDGACRTGAANITAAARRNRRTLSAALSTAGLTNHPAQWWHWSYGDRYWALNTGAPAARYGPADA